MSIALKLEGVSKTYNDFQAVKNLSFSVKTGSICGFLGHNGAGKTSTLRMILGLTAPTAGHIEVLGSTGQKVLDRIGFLPEERGLYRKMKAIDTIVFFAGLKGIKASVARARGIELLEAQGLGPFIYKQVGTLSKGMQQKVQLISALVHKPEFVILDEPFSGLDPVNQQGLENLIKSLAHEGATVLFSTHIMQHAERLCENIVMLTKGEKVFEGTVKEARAKAPRFLELEGSLNALQIATVVGIKSIFNTGPDHYSCELDMGANPLDVLKILLKSGLDIQGFEAKEPSLHEAFMVLTGDHNA